MRPLPPAPDRFVLVLSAAERDALIRALETLEDNWWLSAAEQEVLFRLEHNGPRAPGAAPLHAASA